MVCRVCNVAMIRRLLVSVVLLCSASSLAQMTGELYLDKAVYAPGEPVYLNFRLTNHDTVPHQLSQSDPDGFCSPFRVKVSSDPATGESCAKAQMFGDCESVLLTLAPGESQTERLLLNYRHRIREAGEYEVAASREADPRSLGNSVRTEANLHFRVDASRAPEPSTLQALVDQLSSPDFGRRRDAELTLAATAPRELEDTLITLATAKRRETALKPGDQFPCELPAVAAVREFEQFAPMALFNLHTERSLAALAELLVRSDDDSFESIESADYLAQTGDQRWLPLLRKKALSNPNRFAFYVARMQGDDSISFLLELMHSQERKLDAKYAPSVLGQTGSPRAVPILIELLNTQDSSASEALRALRLLTRKTVEGNWRKDPSSQYPRWKSWWQQSQSTTRIYKADECGDVSLLP